MDQSESLSAEPLNANRGLPLLITPRKSADLLELIHTQHDWLEERLLAAGALLLRGFGVNTVEKFDAMTAAFSPSRASFAEESSPRSQLLGAVYTSTNYPKDY